jgi:lysylphosphatidylglycerol synthetase-like protein (DUF2156 family)
MSRYAIRWLVTLALAVAVGVLFGFVVVPVARSTPDDVRSWLGGLLGVLGALIVIAILAFGQRWAKKAR